MNRQYSSQHYTVRNHKHMKYLRLLTPFVVLVFCSAGPAPSKLTDETEIKALFEKTYFEVFCRKGDPQVLRETFHPAFNMYIYYNGEITVRSLEGWLARLDANRGKGKLTSGKVTDIEVTGNVARATVELYENEKIVYTDYFTLYKLEDGWKVFTKTFNFHE